MPGWLSDIWKITGDIPPRVLMAMVLVFAFASSLWALSADRRIGQLETNDKFLTCRALELDAHRDPAACRYFLQGNAESFRPPENWRRPLPDPASRDTPTTATVP